MSFFFFFFFFFTRMKIRSVGYSVLLFMLDYAFTTWGEWMVALWGMSTDDLDFFLYFPYT